MKIYSFFIALMMTFSTLTVAALLNESSSSRHKPVHHAVAIAAKPSKEKPKAKRRPIKRRKKLKNIKQAPRVSPNVAISLDIPLEMPQVESLHAHALKESIEIQPPVPSATNSPPEYPLDARTDGIQGRVVAAALIDEYGFVVKVRISSSQPVEVFDAAVKSALRDWKFSPARRQGEPVEQWVEIPFNFVL